jgi:putative phosphoribosyl transferase
MWGEGRRPECKHPVAPGWPGGEHWEPMTRVFADRRDAGRRLAHRLGDLSDGGEAPTGAPRDDVVVLGLPRGGVPVAAEVAAALSAPLDILVVGKVGVPGHEELALAAVADDGTVVVNAQVQAATGLSDAEVDTLARRHVAALARRGAELRPGRAPIELAGRTVVLVDDGMATGATMRVALEVVRHRGPRRVIVAVPVAPLDAAGVVAPAADRVVCVMTPRDFHAVGPWYADFTQVTDAEVRALLAQPPVPAPEHVDDA